MLPKDVDYKKDHTAIPTYQKETESAVEHKKAMFSVLAGGIVSEITFDTHLDIGCGSGYLVSAMRNLEKNSYGAEIGYMFHNGLFPEIKEYVFEKSIFQLNDLPEKYDLVSAIEVLEHLYAENFYKNDLNNALINLIQKSNKYIFLTVPILTPDYCPWLDWNERDPQIWPRILKMKEIPLNSDKTPILGHVTLATEAWWRCKLESFGLNRMKNVEDAINNKLKIVDPGLLEWWHVFVYEKN